MMDVCQKISEVIWLLTVLTALTTKVHRVQFSILELSLIFMFMIRHISCSVVSDIWRVDEIIVHLALTLVVGLMVCCIRWNTQS